MADGGRIGFVEAGMTLNELQELVGKLYGNRDAGRGIDATVAALDDRIHRISELADAELNDKAKTMAAVLVEVTSIANQAGVDLNEALRYYVHGCPECGHNPCDCN